MDVNEQDRELIRLAAETIAKNYDLAQLKHTVGAALRCGSGRIYTGVNLYSVHNVCAEQVALGAAYAAGEREFLSVTAVTGEQGEILLAPCGCCRQILAEMAPDCLVILPGTDGPCKLPASALIPLPYRSPRGA